MRTPSLRTAVGAGLFAVVGALAACKKTDDGQLQVQVPEVDVKVGRDTLTIPAPSLPGVDVGTKRDTVTVPTVGTKRTEVRRPTVDVKRP